MLRNLVASNLNAHTQNAHLPASTIDTRVEAYTANHAEDVRDLAETIDVATSGYGGMLDDEEDSRCWVFREAIRLYAAKHNIGLAELSAALREWKAAGVE